jgi:hypothetical protein
VVTKTTLAGGGEYLKFNFNVIQSKKASQTVFV